MSEEGIQYEVLSTEPPSRRAMWVELLVSRKFWAAVVGVVAVLIGAFVPNASLDVEHAVPLLIVLASYMLGVAIDPGPGGWRGVVMSRKFWTAAFGLAVIFMDAFHLALPAGITSDQLALFAALVGAYIGSLAVEKPKWIRQ